MNKQPLETQAYSIEAFCKTHHIARATYYLLVKQGKAPRTFRVGKKPLISVEAAAEWRRQMEAESAAA